MEIAETKNDAMRYLEGKEHDALVLACMKNHWLSFGLWPTINDASESPQFTIQIVETVCGLRDYFRTGSHRIREGVIFKNLAFVQQVDFGDEWLVLRRVFDDETGDAYWMPFESASFERAVSSAARFECTIEALLNADPFDTAVLLGRDQLTRERKRLNRSGS